MMPTVRPTDKARTSGRLTSEDCPCQLSRPGQDGASLTPPARRHNCSRRSARRPWRREGTKRKPSDGPSPVGTGRDRLRHPVRNGFRPLQHHRRRIAVGAVWTERLWSPAWLGHRGASVLVGACSFRARHGHGESRYCPIALADCDRWCARHIGVFGDRLACCMPVQGAGLAEHFGTPSCQPGSKYSYPSRGV